MTIDINIILVIALVLGALATVTTARLLRSAIALAFTSAVLAILMYRLNSPLAAVFELSVCAGLIPAIFISAIGLTGRLDASGLALRRREKLKLYWALPVLLVVALAILLQTSLPADFVAPALAAPQDVRVVLWDHRQIDLIGQIAVLAAGVFGVIILVKEPKSE